MRLESIIAVSSLISSTIAMRPFTNQDFFVQNADHSVQCGSDAYSALELKQATTRGCQSIMKSYMCREAGNCENLKEFVGPKEYTGLEFEGHKKKLYIWGLPTRQDSELISNVIFDDDPVGRKCKTLGASFSVRNEQRIHLCEKLNHISDGSAQKSLSPSRHRIEIRSSPRREGNRSPPRQYYGNRSPPRSGEGNSYGTPPVYQGRYSTDDDSTVYKDIHVDEASINRPSTVYKDIYVDEASINRSNKL